MVTDGGMYAKDGYFGWVIATETTILWEARGYVQANPNMIESLRTEGMSQLALMTFLKQYCPYHGIAIPKNKSVHYTDNKGIVERMSWFQSRTLQTVWECLAPTLIYKHKLKQYTRKWK
eukprot:6030248-Ditylum_brightwellii.AAC.1